MGQTDAAGAWARDWPPAARGRPAHPDQSHRISRRPTRSASRARVDAASTSAPPAANQFARRKLSSPSRPACCEPVGSFPAMGRTHHRAAASIAHAGVRGAVRARQGVPHRGNARRTAGRNTRSPCDAVIAVGPCAKAAAVHRQRIHRRRAMGHPVGQEPSSAAALHHAHGRAGQQPGILDPCAGPINGFASGVKVIGPLITDLTPPFRAPEYGPSPPR